MKQSISTKNIQNPKSGQQAPFSIIHYLAALFAVFFLFQINCIL